MYEPSDVLPNGISSFSTSQFNNYTRFREKLLIDADISSLISLSRLLYNTLIIIENGKLSDKDIAAAKYAVKELEKLSIQLQDDCDMIHCLEGFRYIETAVENINRTKNKAATNAGKARG